jgi:hypothetical protein
LKLNKALTLNATPIGGTTMDHGIKWSIFAAGLALSSALGPGSAQAANLLATETGDTASLVPDANWDRTPFTSTSTGESATGSGAFLANSTATGSALVVLTEGPNDANSDWLELVYSGAGGRGTETVRAIWNSDADPGGLPALPTGVTPMFLSETGASQDVTALLGASATASGFSFPSNITVQAQSDAPEAVVPELSTWAMMLMGFVGLGYAAYNRSTKAKVA